MNFGKIVTGIYIGNEATKEWIKGLKCKLLPSQIAFAMIPKHYFSSDYKSFCAYLCRNFVNYRHAVMIQT